MEPIIVVCIKLIGAAISRDYMTLLRGLLGENVLQN